MSSITPQDLYAWCKIPYGDLETHPQRKVPFRLCRDSEEMGRLMARELAAERDLAGEVMTEIKAYAIGAHHLYPDVQTVLDIGGQDSKVIRVRPERSVAQFEMNDRCAAGTGRFLETMALALGLGVEQLGQHALDA